MTAEDWQPAGRAMWVYTERDPNVWKQLHVICQCKGPDKWVVKIGYDEPVVVPSWREVLDVTPMLIGIYKARKSP